MLPLNYATKKPVICIGRSTRSASRIRLRLNDETEKEREIRLCSERKGNNLSINRKTSVEWEVQLGRDRN